MQKNEIAKVKPPFVNRLKKRLRLVLEKKKLIFIFFILGIAIATSISFLLTKYYQAAGKVVFKYQSVNNSLLTRSGSLEQEIGLLQSDEIIAHTIEKFDKSSLVDETIVVCHKDHLARLTDIIDALSLAKPCKAIAGGETRQESAFNGIKNAPEGTEYVLIHDAVRPLVTDRIIEEVLAAAKEKGAAMPVLSIKDTLVEAKENIAISITDRRNLKRVQTPQGDHFNAV